MTRAVAVTEGAVMGIGEAAVRLGRSRTSVQKLVDSGRLPSFRTEGGHRRILEASLQAYRGGAASRPPEPPVTRPADASGLHVLVVDDDQVAATFVRHLALRHLAGSTVAVVRDGLQAVGEIQRRRPDLVVTDLNMTAFDGFRLAWLLHVDAGFRDVGLLVVSTLSLPEVLERGGLPPGAAILRKPMPAGAVIAFLRARQVQARRQDGTR